MKLLRNYEVMNIDPDKQLASDPNQKVEKNHIYGVFIIIQVTALKFTTKMVNSHLC